MLKCYKMQDVLGFYSVGYIWGKLNELNYTALCFNCTHRVVVLVSDKPVEGTNLKGSVVRNSLSTLCLPNRDRTVFC